MSEVIDYWLPVFAGKHFLPSHLTTAIVERLTGRIRETAVVRWEGNIGMTIKGKREGPWVIMSRETGKVIFQTFYVNDLVVSQTFEGRTTHSKTDFLAKLPAYFRT